jgi:uncharacterized membrane protein
MTTLLLGAMLGVAVIGTAIAMPLCVVRTASGPEPAIPAAVPVLRCEPGSSMAPFAGVWISEC